MFVEPRASLEIRAAPEVVFDLVSDDSNFPRFLHAVGRLPGVTACTPAAPGPEGLPRRTVSMSDGSTVEQEVQVADRPRHYSYRWSRLPAKPLLRLIVRAAETHWTFEPSNGGTRVIWRYTFTLTSPLFLPLGLLFRRQFQSWMEQGLARVQTALSGRTEPKDAPINPPNSARSY
jgi:uncharacterized protein YndB with AHSA1/START domain